MANRKIIIAQNYRQLVAWCQENNLAPTQVVWANRAEVLQGLEIAAEDVIRIGVPENAKEIEEMLLTRIRVPLDRGHSDG